MKLQSGDYISVEGMTDEEYYSIYEKFIEAGAKTVYNESIRGDETKCLVWIGNDVSQQPYTLDYIRKTYYRYTIRELSLEEFLNCYDTTMRLKESYKIMQANCGIEPGDTVKVLRKAEDREMGWGRVWSCYMDKAVGKTFVVDGLDLKERSSGISLDGLCGEFPFFVLEIVKKAQKLPEPIEINSKYQCEFKRDGSIIVPRTLDLDFELIEEIYLTAKKVKEDNS